MRVTIEVDVSKTVAETMQRNGFNLCKDGSAMQVKVGNAPAIPRRKTKVNFEPINESKQEEVTV